ncbi:hypothetical protein DICPUDRAFT_157235 [Dictyostelium purpureum]|uniref:Uncharacterized protein n=1 Tax=Dictyostelium purpureum TaxID=5786 RepID=F0ZYM1_DICPU|nr:uncharacterized protein DICPUDRAFT_157235 [Dictyostelium purpureum]EGC30964.1 hypothetical protein DICPUDRAFT_157235 [Dictyostelium purpureum]|eukprot:XP_003292515.1 hypothetical protein DICPUDRAFT_157235 [Dictyostelium purpureum]
MYLISFFSNDLLNRNPGHQFVVEEELSFLINTVLKSIESGQLETWIYCTVEEHKPLVWVSHPLIGL